MKPVSFALSLLFVTHSLFASNFNQDQSEAVFEESLYDSYTQNIKANSKSLYRISLSELQKPQLFIDALWDQITTQGLVEAQNSLSELSTQELAFADQLRIEILRSWPQKATLPLTLTEKIELQLSQSTPESRRLRALLQSSKDLVASTHYRHWTFKETNLAFRTKTKEEIQDLFYRTPSAEAYNDGEYKETVRLFMFCRAKRIYPCMMVMKNKHGQPVLKEDGETLWHQPSLGMSKFRIHSSQRNGNTPSGVLTMDSVMPFADKQVSFGKYRRVILNFVPHSENEEFHKMFLPESAHSASWWKEAVVARDAGRGLLRIHGTGRIKTTPRDPHHPLRPTLGCVMQREGHVSGVTYKDQRHLLDQSMMSLDLEPIYDNETRIKGVMYLIELDAQRRAVSYNDVAGYLDL